MTAKRIAKIILFLLFVTGIFVGGFVVGVKVVIQRSEKANLEISNDMHKIIYSYDELLEISETKNRIDGNVIEGYVNHNLDPETVSKQSYDWNKLDVTQKGVKTDLLPLLNKYGINSFMNSAQKTN